MVEARIIAWDCGIVAPWYLRDSQLDLYYLLLAERYPFIQAARRFGKTNSVLAFVIEKLLQNPGWIARWCFPFKNQAREVLTAEITKIQAFCTDRMKFHYQTTDSVFIHRNGSKLFIRGVNEDRGESARGPASNIIVADEYGFWNEPKYIIQSVLFPQLENQEGRHLIKASTPPPNLGHLYYSEREVAKRKNRFITKTIYDNEALSKEELQEIIDECGGVESIPFRRERMCEDIGDPELLVVPEFNDDNVVSDDYPRPEYYDPYIGGDSGADDNTANLFGYYDFLKNEVVIEDELVLNNTTTEKIVLLSKLKEIQNWNPEYAANYSVDFEKLVKNILLGIDYDTAKTEVNFHFSKIAKKAFKRVYDAGKQLIYDIYADHKWPVQVPDKADKHAAIHELRIEVGQRRFKVKRKCVQTINQLKVGMWRDSKKLDFERTEGLGHLDAVAASIYIQRCVDRKHNPWPLNHGINEQTHYIPHNQNPHDESSAALAGVFRPKRRVT